MLPEIGRVVSVPSYLPLQRDRMVTEVVPLRERPVSLEGVSPAALAARVSYHSARISHLHREAFYLFGDFLRLSRGNGCLGEMREKLEVFGYLCEEARALLAERPVLVEAARRVGVSPETAMCLWRSAVEWVGMIGINMAVAEMIKKHVAALLERVADKIGAQL